MNNSVLIFGLCSVTLIAVIFYDVFTRKPKRASHMQSSQVRRNREALGDDECCICLSEEKKFQVSITCGHSFCGKCLLDLYDHSTQKLKCPLCRQEINAIFKVFHDEEPKEQGRKISQKIREYNHRFSDDRSFMRKFSQFPYVLRALSDRLFTRDFIRYFFSSGNLLKMAGTMLFYLISPLDLLPQLLLGPMGYLDDIGFIVVVFLYTVANSAVEYVRNRE